jgi:hypothetical protein
VNQAFVATPLQREDPIGRQMAIGGGAPVVGVVGDIQQKRSFGRYGPVARRLRHVPAAQVSSESFVVHTWFSPSWIVRTSRGTAEAGAEMQRALRGRSADAVREIPRGERCPR